MKNVFKVNGRVVETLNRVGQTALMFALTAAPALADGFQQQAQSKLSAIQAVLIGVSATTATIAGAYVGNKMMFHQAKWPEVSQVAIGGTIVACASAFGAWIVG